MNLLKSTVFVFEKDQKSSMEKVYWNARTALSLPVKNFRAELSRVNLEYFWPILGSFN
jgi:hypothetical protein